MSLIDMYGLRAYKEVEDKRVVLLQSGGLDSGVLAALYSKLGYTVHHLFIDYGFCSVKRDLKNAKKLVDNYGGTLHTATMKMPWLELKNADEMEYVPVRNAMLLSMAWSLCESLGFPYVSAAFDGRESIVTHEPLEAMDTHITFARKIAEGLNEGSRTAHNGKPIRLLVPLIGLLKEDIITIGELMGLDFALTSSCLGNEEKPCGKCTSCLSRKEAFEHINLKDPLFE